jgi:hypothetical protein
LNSGGPTDRRSPETPLANRICAGVAIAFAVWTVCAHGTVALGGSLHQLLAVFGTAAFGAVAATLWIVRSLPPEQPPERTDAVAPRPRIFPALQVAALAVAVGLAANVATTPLEATRLWWVGIAMLGVSAVAFLLFEAPVVAAPAPGRRPENARWGVAVVCAGAAGCINPPVRDHAV